MWKTRIKCKPNLSIYWIYLRFDSYLVLNIIFSIEKLKIQYFVLYYIYTLFFIKTCVFVLFAHKMIFPISCMTLFILKKKY